MMLIKEIHDQVMVLTFNHEKPQNPFSDALQESVLNALSEAESDDNILAVVLYGGQDRSFSVGGDFKEIIDKSTYEIVSKALAQVVDFYISILKITKPVLAAIDHYCIGMGFQVSLCVDYRVVSDRAKFIMPELKNGVACTLGGLMLENLVGRLHMIPICFDGERIPLEDCKRFGIANEITLAEDVLERTIAKAKYYGSFPSVAFRGTKRVNNARFIAALEAVKQDTIDVHFSVFDSQQHRKHMENILSK
ncbi:MAG: enoyl-CoA hydratase/isomerase family protein [Chitinophagales bacterium]|nr:enoyl-CoA hydratase/isomerase family protein [Chitinophagales bacterium]